MNGCKIQTRLSGHSGCKIFLMENESKKPFVRKISKDVGYNARLKSQCEKQKHFRHQLIRTPKIFSQGITDDGLFYFDMEYIHGITLAEYIRKIDVNEIHELVDILTSQIEQYTYRGYADNSAVFLSKLEDLNSKIHSPVMRRGLELLFEHDWKHFPLTFCHGDLTLENIIICKGNFYFIDFLDSFFDCFILDIATLLQDAQCMWYYRFEQNLDVNVKIRLLIFRDLLIEKMSMYDVSTKDILCALLLKLIRICPYAKDDGTIAFLESNAERLERSICQH